jgi:hypothetical protein
LKEETGLYMEDIEINQTEVFDRKGDRAFAFLPFCCEQMLEGPYPYIGFIFIVKARGEPKETKEARGLKWVGLGELGKMVKNKDFHTYHLGTLEMYLNKKANSNPR